MIRIGNVGDGEIGAGQPRPTCGGTSEVKQDGRWTEPVDQGLGRSRCGSAFSATAVGLGWSVASVSATPYKGLDRLRCLALKTESFSSTEAERLVVVLQFATRSGGGAAGGDALRLLLRRIGSWRAERVLS